MENQRSASRVAIACGGTGGHLFPGIAVGEALKRRGCAVTLLISQKDVDQKAVAGVAGMNVEALPAIGLTYGKRLAFVRGFACSYRAAAELFKIHRPEAVLAMGGFTSAPPVLAGRSAGAPTFLHESNTIPGRANRWLSWLVTEAFVGFPEAGRPLHTRAVKITGTPVRPQFQATDMAECRAALGLDPRRPVLLVTGGSQGATGLNNLIIAALPFLVRLMPELQLFHLTGPDDVEKARLACASNQIKAIVRPFFSNMPAALGAATLAISRAGASSLAELAAMRVPSILVPFPAATDNHQYYNAFAYEKSGAASLLPQRGTSPEGLASTVAGLLKDESARGKMRAALAVWDAPKAAEDIARRIMEVIMERRTAPGKKRQTAPANLKNHQTIS